MATNGVGTRATGVGTGPQVLSTSGKLEVLCGPLLNYRRLSNPNTSNTLWHGSVLLVSTPGQQTPELALRFLGQVGAAAQAGGRVLNLPDHVDGGTGPSVKSEPPRESRKFEGVKLYEDPKAAFWRFTIDLPLQEFESHWEYNISGITYVNDKRAAFSPQIFTVPAASENMRIMFHSCNGFSVGTDEDAWSGCALWNDVLRQHKERPVHVMIGGGDQIYNDCIRVSGPLKEWTSIANPRRRRDYPFGEKLRADCDAFYFDNYVKWYSTAPFSDANAIIPQLNIWDDHDIIDGFGSYTDHFMKCPVFRGIGGVAHKYYLLFQHHLAPPKSTFTTDAPQTTTAADPREDQAQLKDTYVLNEPQLDTSYIVGPKPGPYVEQHSTSIFTRLGAHIAFMGIDARTERTRHQINYPETYKMLFQRVDTELAAANGAIKHFILLLGVPIAYPRLQWLENFLNSPLIGPIRFLNKRFGFAGGLFNEFDGNVDLLDDLDDHYTAHQHKRERRELILSLQKISRKHSVRITILGGDVHLAAFGRFYSHPRLAIPAEHDFRYMPNIVSSAITNHPPPATVANLLSRRNKIHHLDHDTDETLLNLFDQNPGEKNGKSPGPKTAKYNHCTMPSRNYALISSSSPTSSSAAAAPSVNGTPAGEAQVSTADAAHHNTDVPRQLKHQGGNPRDAMTAGELGCGTQHAAAGGSKATGLGGEHGLDVAYRVEIDHSDRQGITDGYGLSIPALDVSNYREAKQEA